MEFIFKYKKILFIIGFIGITIFFGYIIYTLFFQATPQQTQTAEETSQVGGNLPLSGPGGVDNIITTTNSTGIPTTGDINKPADQLNTEINDFANGGLTKTEELNQSPSIAVTSSKNGSNIQYYNQSDGKFYTIDQNNNIRTLSDKIFPEATNVTWSPNKNKAIIEFPDNAKIIYDFSTNKQISLPAHWKDFDFSPIGDKIVMKSMGLDPSNRWLAITNEDGSKTQKIELLGEKDETVYPSWSPNNQTIAIYTEGVDFNRQEVYFVGLNSENFKSTIIEGRGFQPKWSPQGDKLLYSVYSSDTNMNPNLWIVNAQGDNIGSSRKNLNIATWADKCSYANATTLYCAVPKNLDENSGLFPELAKATSDNLYEINTQTGTKKMIATPNGDYNISNIVISGDGRSLYFTDEANKYLRKINLK